VISRALGAEASVEADMKTIEVEEGNSFLLCTDGITRHIPDGELRELLMSGRSAEAICTEMKERCYQRGAEDNLTAVMVQLGPPPQPDTPAFDDERTISNERYESATASSPATVQTRLTPPSRIAFPGPSTPLESAPRGDAKRQSGGGRTVLRFLLFVFIAVGSFYAGMQYQQGRLFPSQNVTPQPSPSPADSATAFEQKRVAVDANPQKWLADNLPLEFAKEGIAKTADSKDPEFLYLYGRALMLTGNHREAIPSFELALNNLRTEPKGSLPLGAEIKLAAAAAALKLKNQSPAVSSQERLMAEQKAARLLDELLHVKSEGTTR
jgi:protein phosphatase